MHAISGCDTVGYIFGKGKVSALFAMVKHKVDLEQVGEPNASLGDIIQTVNKIISVFYGSKDITLGMNALRHAIFLTTKDTP